MSHLQQDRYRSRTQERASLILAREGLAAAQTYLHEERQLSKARRAHARISQTVASLEAIERIIRQGINERFEDGPGSDGEDTELLSAVIPSGAAILHRLRDLVGLVGVPIDRLSKAANGVFSRESLNTDQRFECTRAAQELQHIKLVLKQHQRLSDYSRDSRDLKSLGVAF